MKPFITSAFCLLIVLSSWAYFCHYSEILLDDLSEKANQEIMTAVTDGDWAAATTQFEALKNIWDEYQRPAHYFFETAKLNDIDYSLIRIDRYLKSNDPTAVSSELAYLSQQLHILYENEQLSLANLL